ncbi:F0F1 ATP synthase subunit epsilon, partial [Cutibacterium acnes subsp. acnes]|nr:F0F1 ATP synthase subunit epsilon [Cutibacterium acnes subsp. acnes]
MDHPPLQVKVVSADREVWKGESVNIIVRTTEGDIGLLPGHEAFLAALAPCAAQIITTDGNREVIACDG